jgi:hypothetical protein
MSVSIKHKRGDTFIYHGVVRETRNGPVMNITDWTITSMIRTQTDALIAEADVTITDGAAGEYTVRVDNTIGWPVDYLHWDIQHADGAGDIRSTETVLLRIVADVNYPDP